MANKVTLDDVKQIRWCAEELQKENVKHYGGEPGLEVLRRRSEAVLAVADKLEKRLHV